MRKCDFLIQNSRKATDLIRESLVLQSSLSGMTTNKRNYISSKVIPNLQKDINFYLDLAIDEANRLLEERKYER